ncbi:MAG: NAD-dependent epimerase/dehydratase family protein, partial [Chloroflexota bacterium]
MKVLVTGGCGFIGSHVCEYYRNQGAQVIAYDNMTKHELMRTGYTVDAARDYNWELLKGWGVTLVREDVRDFDKL